MKSDKALKREEERRLLAAARDGDARALGRLVEILSGPAYRFGRTFCRNPQDAEDVMQDVLTSAVKSLRSFAGRSSLTTWAYAVARNACSHMRRRRVGQPAQIEPLEAPGNGKPLDLPDARFDPARDVETTEIREALRRALAELPPAHREAVLLRDVEGLPAARAARILKINERALKSRLHRGRAALRLALSAHSAGKPARVADPGKCPDTVRLMSRHLEGDLDTAVCARLESHVQECPDCLEACDSLRKTLAACRSLGRERPPAHVKRVVRGALRRGGYTGTV